MRIPKTLRFIVGPFELIHELAGPRPLRFVRAGLISLWMVKLLLDPLWRLAEFPQELRIPTGILGAVPDSFINGLFTRPGLITLWISTLLVLMACLVNKLFPLFCTLAAVLLTIYSTLIRSFGPAVHTDIVPLLAVYALACFSWADVFAGKVPNASGRRNSSAPLVTIVALLCLSYCLVGINRFWVGGWPLFSGDTMEVWTIDASLRGYFFNTNVGWHVAAWPLLVLMLKLGLPVITLFEITAPLCLVSSHYRWVFIPTMMSFHLLSLLLMNIFFFDDMLLYLLLIDWSRRFPWLRYSASEGPLEASTATPVP